MGLKEFRIANDLTQQELGDYLGVGKSFLSKVESGKCKLPKGKSQQILTNDKGWDTSCLTVPSTSIVQQGNTNVVGRGKNLVCEYQELVKANMKIEELQEQIKRLEKQNGEYWATIKRFLEKYT